MFTGIIETQGEIVSLKEEGSNIHFDIASDISDELKIDQSVAHDGVCLTVVHLESGLHRVTAIKESLNVTNLSTWKPGRQVNLERCMIANGRYDGHIVQGHVDTVAECEDIKLEDGSWRFFFKHPESESNLTVKKGSVTINGISLTVVDSSPTGFSVAIIPYTYEHTNLNQVKPGDKVNIEFDIIGKYVAELLSRR